MESVIQKVQWNKKGEDILRSICEDRNKLNGVLIFDLYFNILPIFSRRFSCEKCPTITVASF